MIKIKITDEQLISAVAISTSMMDVLRNLGLKLAGGTSSHYKRRIEKLNLDITHFLGKGSNKGKQSKAKVPAEEILIKREAGNRQKHRRLKRALIESGVEHSCKMCGQLPEWHGRILTLDVDHINEDWLDDRKENLRFLCPNCHSQFSRKLLPC